MFRLLPLLLFTGCGLHLEASHLSLGIGSTGYRESSPSRMSQLEQQESTKRPQRSILESLVGNGNKLGAVSSPEDVTEENIID